MPKIKTHSGTKDRIKITKTGKILHRKASGNHLLQKKSASRKRTFAGHIELDATKKQSVRRKLGV
jgi:large subunit ribosomal protein L35